MSDQIEYSGFELSEFAENPEPRVPCVLLLDTSGSMCEVVANNVDSARQSAALNGSLYTTGSGLTTRINSLNEGLNTFKETLAADSLASRRAEIAIVTFGGVVTTVQEFVTAQHFHPPQLQASGSTPMGSAILTGLDMITKRKSVYKAAGIAYYRPWVFLITDGGPDLDDPWMAAAEKVKQGEASKSLAFFTVGVEGANMSVLSQISMRQPVKLKGVNFREMFLWLSQSMQAVSQSSPSDQVLLAPPGWTEV